MSIFKQKTISQIVRDIQNAYLSTDYDWVVGYSTGKDSETTLQLVWRAVAGLPEELRKNHVYVVSSDTLVETPMMKARIHNKQQVINRAAQQQNLPISAHIVHPEISQTYWVNLIGRGYAAPSRMFRWCTNRLKIDPVTRFIESRAEGAGQVIVVLGSRRSESASRGQVIAHHEKVNSVTGTPFRYHSDIHGAYIYTPIQEWTTDDVWSWLLNVDSPFGGKNRDLAAMYRSANSGECPLVMDTSTPSCGNSRFGCWTCTVVTRDKSMEAMIDNGEEWLLPLLELRDYLSSTQEPTKKHLYRSHLRAGGRVDIDAVLVNHGEEVRVRGRNKIDQQLSVGAEVERWKLVRGSYYIRFCKEVLRRLLIAQVELNNESDSDEYIELITIPELQEIQRIWSYERYDWGGENVSTIYEECIGKPFPVVHSDTGLFREDEYNILAEACEGAGVDVSIVQELLGIQLSYQGMSRRAGVYGKLGRALQNAAQRMTEDEVREAYPGAMNDEYDTNDVSWK